MSKPSLRGAILSEQSESNDAVLSVVEAISRMSFERLLHFARNNTKPTLQKPWVYRDTA